MSFRKVSFPGKAAASPGRVPGVVKLAGLVLAVALCAAAAPSESSSPPATPAKPLAGAPAKPHAGARTMSPEGTPSKPPAAAPASPPPVAPGKPASPRRPDLVLITAEGLRPDFLSCYKGKEAASTPNIDSLAAQGRLFSQVLTSSPSSLPALATLLTGKTLYQHRVWDDDYRNHLSSEAFTLAERLKKDGYHTAAFVGTSRVAAGRGLDQGFDLYQDGYRVAPTGVWRLQNRPGKRVIPAAKSWLEGESASPVFLWFHFMETTIPPPSTQTQSAASLVASSYAARVAEIDQNVGEVLKILRERNRYENSVIVLTADHGMGLGEHGEWRSGVFVYDSTVRVPLVIKTLPGDSAKGKRSDDLAGLVDFFPTVERLLGVVPTPGLPGRDLLASSSSPGPSSPSARAYSAVALFGREEFGWHPQEVVALGTLRLITGTSARLFDVAADPAEEHDLSASDPAKVRSLRQEAKRLSAGKPLPPAHFQPGRGLPEELATKLVQMGYAPPTPENARKRKLPDPHAFLAGLRLLETAAPAVDLIGYTAVANVRGTLLQDDPEGLFNLMTVAQLDLSQGSKSPEALAQLGEFLKNAQKIYPLESEVYHVLGHVAAMQKKFADAEIYFLAAMDLSPRNPGEVSYDVACAYAREGKKEAAVKQLKDAIHRGFRDSSHISTDPDLDSLRQDPAYKRLIQEEFPAAS